MICSDFKAADGIRGLHLTADVSAVKRNRRMSSAAWIMTQKTCRLVTLGCKVNQYETQLIKEGLERNGYREARRK